MRVQAFVDLLSESCLAFSVDPFTRNDQKASADILKVVRRGDLVVRDPGYSCLSVFGRLTEAGVNLLSRLRNGTGIFDADGEPIDLLSRLERHGRMDAPVLLGAAKIPVRLIAVKVPEAVAAERRRKARANRDRRLNHSPRYMRLLGWQILVTTVPPEKLGPDEAVKVYSLRWRIETLFKAWKSHFAFGAVPKRASAEFVGVLILAALLYVAFFQCVFLNLQEKNSRSQPAVSPLKLASLIQNLTAYEFRLILDQLSEADFIRHTLYHCRYDKRRRPNHFQIISDLSLISLG